MGEESSSFDRIHYLICVCPPIYNRINRSYSNNKKLHEHDNKHFKTFTAHSRFPPKIQNISIFLLIQRCRYWYERGFCPFNQFVLSKLSSAPSPMLTKNSEARGNSTSTIKPRFVPISRTMAFANMAKDANFYTLKKLPLYTHVLTPPRPSKLRISVKSGQMALRKPMIKDIRNSWVYSPITVWRFWRCIFAIIEKKSKTIITLELLPQRRHRPLRGGLLPVGWLWATVRRLRFQAQAETRLHVMVLFKEK